MEAGIISIAQSLWIFDWISIYVVLVLKEFRLININFNLKSLVNKGVLLTIIDYAGGFQVN